MLLTSGVAKPRPAYYQLNQLGTGGCTEKAKPVQGVYPNPTRPTHLHLHMSTGPSIEAEAMI